MGLGTTDPGTTCPSTQASAQTPAAGVADVTPPARVTRTAAGEATVQRALIAASGSKAWTALSNEKRTFEWEDATLTKKEGGCKSCALM